MVDEENSDIEEGLNELTSLEFSTLSADRMDV
jgi:hypothetical protein